ncbi:hypothetical protein IFM89_000390 [Coptis chinensis]|uniref:Uncharacterized protein n=1 Tax=Coptis chinensis TaxID=261450 RepID=A0A835HC08_9MAGN|nr:hypothetical protein IFM89_000390 [Coptis chinensis]
MGMGKRYLLGMGGIGRGIGKNAERDVKFWFLPSPPNKQRDNEARQGFDEVEQRDDCRSSLRTALLFMAPSSGVDIKMNTHLKTVKPTPKGKNPVTLDHPTETPRVKPKKPKVGRPMGRGRVAVARGDGRGGGR